MLVSKNFRRFVIFCYDLTSVFKNDTRSARRYAIFSDLNYVLENEFMSADIVFFSDLMSVFKNDIKLPLHCSIWD
jgi:hypothetical protein